jgi:Cytochrome c7 and related cytochrome c/Class III cytochrome C family
VTVNRVLNLVLGTAVGLATVGILLFFPGTGAARESEFSTPSGQPIEFSHELHAGTLGMSCASCHTGVLEGRVARIPSLQRCLDCHRAQENWEDVKHVDPRTAMPSAERQDADSRKLREIGKLLWYERQGMSIPWRAVSHLPDHVDFDHKRHVRSGISCRQCHGDVTRMGTAGRKKKLTMSFCVECHMGSRRGEPLQQQAMGITGDVYRPDSALERLSRNEPAMWSETDPARGEIEGFMNESGWKTRPVPFDCATCHV